MYELQIFILTYPCNFKAQRYHEDSAEFRGLTDENENERRRAIYKDVGDLIDTIVKMHEEGPL